MSAKRLAIGIDLGTTKSCVGIWRDDKVEILNNDLGNYTTQSCVAFTSGERIIGDYAKNNIFVNSKNTVFNVKRLIGRRYKDLRVQADIKHWPFAVIEDGDKMKVKVEFKGEEKSFTPEEITAMILSKMKEVAENNLKQQVKDAVISVPAYFTDSQRQATKDAGTIAGLNVLRIINEPTATAITYGLTKRPEGERNVLVFDLGGGTFDVSVLKITDGLIFEVKSIAGDTNLGGDDFSYRIMVHFLKEFKRKFKKDLTKSPFLLCKLYTAAELVKKELSSCIKACIKKDSLYEGIDFASSITRSHFEKLCSDLYMKIMCLVKRGLQNAQLNESLIHNVILVGGAINMPKIKNLLTDFFDGKLLDFTTDPTEAVTRGAAIQAAILSGDESALLKNVRLVDVTPLSLGIETSGDVMTKMIMRNSRIPCKQSQVFSTYTDNQLAVTVQVFEGERPMSYDNSLLGTFNLSGIQPAPRGIPQIEVTFDLDNNGILDVTAKDSSTGNTQNIIITNNKGRLSVQEIETMLDDAERYKTEDEMQRERIQARNQLEGYIFNIEQTVKENGEKLSERDKNIIVKKCDLCLKWLDRNLNITKEDLEYQLQDLQLDCSQVLTRYNSKNVKTCQNLKLNK